MGQHPANLVFPGHVLEHFCQVFAYLGPAIPANLDSCGLKPAPTPMRCARSKRGVTFLACRGGFQTTLVQIRLGAEA